MAQQRVHTDRDRISLSGTWEFWPDALRRTAPDTNVIYGAAAERTALLGPPRQIRVPGVWQAQFPDLRWWSGIAWYERAFDVPLEWRQRRVRLCFGAVDYYCTVWINGAAAGSHEGGFLPFDFDVTRLLRFGEPNQVTLRVVDAHGDWTDWKAGQMERLATLPFPIAEIPHGKQSWYGPAGGVWQDVFLEATSPMFVRSALVHGDIETGTARIQAKLGAPSNGGEVLTFRVASPSGTETYSAAGNPLEPGQLEQFVDVSVPNVDAWDVDSPHLYSVSVSLEDESGPVDTWTDTFGFRRVEARDGRIFLNGRPLYLLGALDQDYYHESFYLPGAGDLLERQAALAKDLGLNLLRCHVKVPDPRYLYVADRAGLLVWEELPNWMVLTEGAKRRGRETLAGMIERDFNHPSVIVWNVINEGWGVRMHSEPSNREWIRETYRWTKGLDPTRLVVDNSACNTNFHLESDLNDFHRYWALPDHHDEMHEWLEGWAREPAMTYSPYGDALHRGDEPMVLSEFGSWGLPDDRSVLDADGEEPWWFDTSPDWKTGLLHPRGARSRFLDLALDEVFGSWDEFVKASQEHEFESLKAQIEAIRARPELNGYVITELTDVNWEANGLLEITRTPKAFHGRLRDVNAPDVVIARLDRPRYRPGDTARVELIASHFSPRDAMGASLRWEVPAAGAGGTIEPVDLAAADVRTVGHVSFDIPNVTSVLRTDLRVELVDAHGETIARNSSRVVVFPDALAAPDSARVFASEGLRGSFAVRGWQTSESLAGADVAVIESWSNEAAEFVASGGRSVVLVDSADALPPDGAVTLQDRERGVFKGYWVQGFGWLRPLLTSTCGVGPRVDDTFRGLTPEFFLVGYGRDEADDLWGGYFMGWLQATVGTIGAFAHGEGAGALCTLRLAEGYGTDPLATRLLDRLIELVADPGLRPNKAL